MNKKETIEGVLGLIFIIILGFGCWGVYSLFSSNEELVQKKEMSVDSILSVWKKRGFVIQSSHRTKEDLILEIKARDFDKDQMLIDTKDLLKELSKIKEIKNHSITWRADAVDIYGNTKEVFMGKLVFKEKAFKKINWDNVFELDIPKIADEYKQHPSLEKD